MIILGDADSFPFVVSHFGVKEGLTELDDFKRKMDNYILNIMSSVNSQNYIFYLSGKDNFRKKIDAQKEYKGNRGKGEKPLWFDELRQYLVDGYKANVIHGCEADDGLSISQLYYNNPPKTWENKYKLESCIASLDKDLQQVPGYHLNIKTMVVTGVDEKTAYYNLWKQILTGDTTDHVTGLEGCGGKCAENLLNGAKQENYPQIVLDAYKSKYGDEGEKLFKANYMLIKLMERNNNFKLPEVMNIDEVINGLYKNT